MAEQSCILLTKRSSSLTGRERRDRVAAGPQRDRLPPLAGGLQRRGDAGAHERRLARARRPDDGGDRQLADLRDHARDLGAAPEEAVGVALLERDEAGVGMFVGGDAA